MKFTKEEQKRAIKYLEELDRKLGKHIISGPIGFGILLATKAITVNSDLSSFIPLNTFTIVFLGYFFYFVFRWRWFVKQRTKIERKYNLVRLVINPHLGI